MLHYLTLLNGYQIIASDGDSRGISDFYFDDQTWMIRYLITKIGKPFSKRNVLVSPRMFEELDCKKHVLPVELTQAQLESSPSIDTDLPVALQLKRKQLRHYGWEFYFAGESWVANPNLKATYRSMKNQTNNGGKPFDPHLRAAKFIIGFHIHTADETIGYVRDFLIDETTWSIRFIVANKRAVWPSQNFLLNAHWVKSIHSEDSMIYLDISRDEIYKFQSYFRRAQQGPPTPLVQSLRPSVP